MIRRQPPVSSRVRCRPPVAPLPPADTGDLPPYFGASNTAYTDPDQVGHSQLPEVGHFRLPLTASNSSALCNDESA